MVNYATFEATGNAQGATLTTANSGLDTISGASGGNTAILDSASAAHGSFGGLFTTSASAANGVFGIRNFPTSTDVTFSVSLVVKLPPTAWGVDVTVLRVRSSTGDVCRVTYVTATGKLNIQDAAAATIASMTLASSDLPWGGKIRLQLTGTVGSTTSNGVVTGKVFNQSTTAQIGSTGTSSAANLGTAALFRVYAGVTSTNLGVAVGIDDVQLNSGSSTPLGDYVPPSNFPPTVNAGADQQIALGAHATLSGTATDSDGTVASLAWSVVSVPSGAATPTFTNGTTITATTSALGTPGTYTFRLTATDNGGASSTDDVAVEVLAGAPVVTGSVTTDKAIIDARGSTAAVGTTFVISPSSGTSALTTDGLFLVPPGITYTVTATDPSGQTGSASFTVAAPSTPLSVRTRIRVAGSWVTTAGS